MTPLEVSAEMDRPAVSGTRACHWRSCTPVARARQQRLAGRPGDAPRPHRLVPRNQPGRPRVRKRRRSPPSERGQPPRPRHRSRRLHISCRRPFAEL